jgi:hypothetical protein
MARKRICIIDGQSGGIGAVLIKYLKQTFRNSLELFALGANPIATSNMLKAGADLGVTGENAVIRNIGSADAIVGPVSITWAHAMLGEITPKIAEAVTASRATKILLPLNREGVILAGMNNEPLPHLAEEIAVRHVKASLKL